MYVLVIQYGTKCYSVMVDPGLLGDVRQGQLYLQLDAIDESDRIWEFAEFSS